MSKLNAAIQCILIGSMCGLPTGCASHETKQTPAEDSRNTVQSSSATQEETFQVRLIFTTDEHGWLQPYTEHETKAQLGGVVAVFDHLKSNEELGKPHVLLLSAGDMWTGPYESTILKGAPVVQAFNYMGYAGAAVGNHEFDFGIAALQERAKEASFPFLAANIKVEGTQDSPSWAIPSMMKTVDKVTFGIIGLANVHTDKATDVVNLKGLVFEDYETALKREAPRLRQQGADELVVILHDQIESLTNLLPLLRELDIRVAAGGHAHKPEQYVDLGSDERPQTSDDILFCNAGPYMRSYCKVDLRYRRTPAATGAAVKNTIKMVSHELDVVAVRREASSPVPHPDPHLVAIVDNAVQQSKARGEEILARSAQPITRENHALEQMVTDSWLATLTQAEIAITNAGAIRQDLPAGKIRMRDVISVMPFENELIIVDVTGKQLKEALANHESVVSGVTYFYEKRGQDRIVTRVLNQQQEEVKDTDVVRVIVNSFMYRGGDGFKFGSYDPDPENTTLDWRAPFVMYLKSKEDENQLIHANEEQRAFLETNASP